MSLRASLCLLVLAAIGCGNPQLDAEIATLGGEVAGVEKSEYHRPGQPCLDCHGPYKGAKPEMALAGTIFALPSAGANNRYPVEGARITITDALGLVNGVESPPAKPPEKTTNCAGNFYFTTKEISPAFPYEAKVECPDPNDKTKTFATRTMVTRISRDGSCNGCHHGGQNQSSPGYIVCDDDPMHTGATIYPPVTHDTCPMGVPASSGGSEP